MAGEKRKVEWAIDLGRMRVRAGQFATDAMGPAAETKRATLREGLDGARSAQVEIEFTVGRASINALPADSQSLLQAELEFVGEIDYVVSGGAERRIQLRQKDKLPRDVVAALGRAPELHWDIRLARGIPLTLKLVGGVGVAGLDLSRLAAVDLALECGLGEVLLRLPQAGAPFAARINCGVGKTAIVIAAGANGRLKIRGGVGECVVTIAPEAAVRLGAKVGLGKLSLPKQFKPSGARKPGGFGVGGNWETADYAEAERRVQIEYAGGIGSLRVVCAQPAE